MVDKAFVYKIPSIVAKMAGCLYLLQSVAQLFKSFCIFSIAFFANASISYFFPFPCGPASKISIENQPRKPVFSTALATSSMGKYPPSYGMGL